MELALLDDSCQVNKLGSSESDIYELHRFNVVYAEIEVVNSVP